MAKWRFWLAALAALACRPALGGPAKTVPGHCLAVVDGRTGGTDPCSIDFTADGGFSFEASSRGYDASAHRRTVRLVPDGATGLGAASTTDLDSPAAGGATTALGTLERQGPCWIGKRATLCAWDGEGEMLRNRAAPYTAFHTLLGRNIRSRCHMGECEWLRYDRATVVTHNDREVVLKIDGKSWDTYHPDDRYDRPGRLDSTTKEAWYFRCSHTRPALLSKEEGKDWTLFPYGPDGDGGISGATESTYTAYAAACDGLDHIVADSEGQLLGYDTGREHAGEKVHIDGPADALR